MSERKRICLITESPELMHGKRLIKGAALQCRKYGYDLVVVSSMVYLQLYFEKYGIGEKKIYDLTNYSLFDGVILDTLRMQGNSPETMEKIRGRLAGFDPGAVICIGGEGYADYKTLDSQNDELLREMCRHMVELHGKRKICILTGPQGTIEAESRLKVFLDELSKYGIRVPKEWIIYGDFWYTGGEALADSIADGTIPMPEAVVCASDHMALGLIERLAERGIRVPEDLTVIGFEATTVAAINNTPVTSAESNFAKTAADAVDLIRRVIEPGAELLPYKPDFQHMLNIGRSCGCTPNFKQYVRNLRDSLYQVDRNYVADYAKNRIDIGLLMENYVMEQFASAQDAAQCFRKIYDNLYLLMPFRDFYLCLREDWLEKPMMYEDSFPERMKLALAGTSSGGMSFFLPEQAVTFETDKMIPRMHDPEVEPSLYYFAAIHFEDNTFGYAVLRKNLGDQEHFLNLVYRNFLRFINISLEMVRAKNQYRLSSVRDEMTGLYNRRGMYAEAEKLLENAQEQDLLLACVVDMDGLKYINDTFGHAEGDYGIKLVANAVARMTGEEEICCRAGGDEFYMIGVGQYTEEDLSNRVEQFERWLDDKASNAGKPYRISASIGFALQKVQGQRSMETALSEADVNMYRFKIDRKKQRMSANIKGQKE